MTATNLYRALRDLLPEAPLLVADVTVVHADGTVTVQYPGGGTQRVRGVAAVDDRMFVRAGVLDGPAPELTFITVEE